ncbi:hypothetical protein PENNAL_c0023G00096 [Penicillium nalgiovense]|uniref:Uncharacterized protein n=1 Tax=Penicillium nalgiovense TaxID=60175 RepID=A0A1V6YE98_PENNA|nr:hypothetical protein PENNAL_c0023G00096 [Penicillium nalgiovense]
MEAMAGPPWGTLAVEQYFITNWNYSSTESPDQQRRRLVAGFLDLNLIPIEWVEEWESLPDPPRAPMTEEIDTILRPYRVDALRWRAYNMFNDHRSPVFLRTYYSLEESERANHDELMNIWADTDPFDAESWWAVLDNADHFDFRSDWRRVYNILPEVAGPLSPEVEDRWVPRSRDYYNNARSDFKMQLAQAKEQSPERWREGRDAIIESLAMRLQRLATRTYLIIADEEAFRSGCLRLLYLDGFRNIVRVGRLDPEIDDLVGVISKWMDIELLENTVVGDKYRVSGELGKELYQLTEEDLADPN